MCLLYGITLHCLFHFGVNISFVLTLPWLRSPPQKTQKKGRQDDQEEEEEEEEEEREGKEERGKWNKVEGNILIRKGRGNEEKMRRRRRNY